MKDKKLTEKLIVCKDCGKLKSHKARELCGACYLRWFRATNPKYRQRANQYHAEWRKKHPTYHRDHYRGRYEAGKKAEQERIWSDLKKHFAGLAGTPYLKEIEKLIKGGGK